ncbi:Crp/Fnr family transcriptional regulator [Sphaerotilus natans]|uniref:Crp/Fnr family transcriptional regulator n=1 Tax=Sphaerotilus natans TaxID=34103 RepID=UPI00406CF09A
MPHSSSLSSLQTLLPASLQAQCRTLTLARGTALFACGSTPAFLHHVDSGEVALQRTSPDGAVVVLQRVQRGFVAEASLEVTRYHCDGVTLAETVVTRIPREPLQQALRDDAELALRWIAMLNREVRRLRQHNERLSLPTLQARLLHLIDTEGDANGMLCLNNDLKTLAHELGVSHEALYRRLANMQAGGVIERLPGPPWMLRRRVVTPGAPPAAGPPGPAGP